MRNGLSLNLLFGVLMAGAAAGLLAGLYSGLLLLGLSLPQPLDIGGAVHGPLMINGFLAALISLERAAALELRWTYAAPIGFVLSTIFLISGNLFWFGMFLMTGSLLLVIILAYLLKLHPSTYHFIMLMGVLALLAGNFGFVRGWPVSELAGWWIAFPVLTIFGERLELNRIMRPPEKAQWLFTGLVIVWLVSLSLLPVDRDAFWVISSGILILLSLWLLKYDIARRTIRTSEWPRFSALGMLTAYVWIIIAALFGMWYGLPYAGPVYDAILHIFFVGFVFSMIFAHAAIIIPALTGLTVTYSVYFYLPYLLLNGFLALRIIGDLMWIPELRAIGAYGNVLAILLFLGGILFQVVRSAGFPQKMR